MAFNAIPLILGTGTTAGSFFASQAADRAANEAFNALSAAQTQAATQQAVGLQQATDERVQGLEQGRQDVIAGTQEGIAADEAALARSLDFIDPELVAARGAQNLLNDALGINGPEAQAAFFQNFQDDPGFQAELQDRINAIDRSASARGQLLSGRTLRAVGDEGQRFRRGAITDRLNRLRDVSGDATGVAARGANLISGTGQRTRNALISRGTNLANLSRRIGEARGTGRQAIGETFAARDINIGNALARRGLQRGKNQVEMINALSGGFGTAAGDRFGLGRNALTFGR